MIRRGIVGVGVALAATIGSTGIVSADPPANKIEVPLVCPSIGETTARIPNTRASLDNAKTLVTGISTEYGPGITFDVFGIYDAGRGNAPVYEGTTKGLADRIEICMVDLSEVVGEPGYVVPVGLKLTGRAR